ncbi:hypothetical protein B932_2636 [Gluconobacter oxydans H24]|nr:hypothetical protein B932_2636 [Gluconobacter oxydans H24]
MVGTIVGAIDIGRAKASAGAGVIVIEFLLEVLGMGSGG